MNPQFVLNTPETGGFSQTINRKKPLAAAFFVNKTPGCVYIALHGQNPENARHRVALSKFRTFQFFQAKSIRFFTILHKAACGFKPAFPPRFLT